MACRLGNIKEFCAIPLLHKWNKVDYAKDNGVVILMYATLRDYVSFTFKARIQHKIAVPLKYISNFWKEELLKCI